MAATKNYVDLQNLSVFKEESEAKQARLLAAAQALDIKVARKNPTTGALELFKDPEPGVGATPDYTYLPVAEDIAITDAGGLITATDVEGALAELATASAGGVASKTIYLTNVAGSSETAYSKRYSVWQGANAPDHATDPATLIGTIDIPKDMVVSSGSVGTVTVEDEPYAGAHVGDKYIDLVIANASEDHLYIPANALVDIYTAEQNATSVQVAIDQSTNVISATIVDDAVTAAKIADSAVTTAKINDSAVTTAKINDSAVTTAKIDASAVTTAKIADDAVTADKVAIAVHTESNTVGADGVSVSVSTTDGQVSAVTASIAAETYDAYGSAANALSDAIGTSSDDADDNTIYGAKAYAAEYTDRISDDDIRRLFAESTPSTGE